MKKSSYNSTSPDCFGRQTGERRNGQPCDDRHRAVGSGIEYDFQPIFHRSSDDFGQHPAMLQIHLLMTLLVLLLTPLSMVISRFIAKRSYHLFQKQTETRGIQTQLIEESLTQQNIIQSFNAQEEFIERLHEANDNYAGILSRLSFYSSTVNPSTRFVNALIYALLAGVGAFRIMMGSTLTVGTFK